VRVRLAALVLLAGCHGPGCAELEGRVHALERERDRLLLQLMRESPGPDDRGFDGLVAAPPVPAIDGLVLRADVVVLSIGADHGVERGFHFSVYRGSTFVGKVRAARVGAHETECDVLFTADGRTIRPGDAVATRLQ
jgi:hypothetical protein